MSALTIYREDGSPIGETLRAHAAIAALLGELGVRFDRWEANQPLSPGADQPEIIAAYQDAIDRLNGEYGFQSMDVVALQPDNPKREEFRGKFLSEHSHSDFEVRFFVDGRGAFYLHLGERVYLVLCEKGDLISVPANTSHWFDMGRAPDFKCIRFFTVADGWVGSFTGSEISARLPTFDDYVARL